MSASKSAAHLAIAHCVNAAGEVGGVQRQGFGYAAQRELAAQGVQVIAVEVQLLRDEVGCWIGIGREKAAAAQHVVKCWHAA